MKEEVKLDILKVVLNKYGFSLEDEEVKNFFYGKRRTFEQEGYNDNGEKCEFSSCVKPVIKTVTPLDFENSGYFSGWDNLLDWFLYENSASNPLVWNNIGNETFDVLTSFKNTRMFKGPIRQGLDGKFYNGEDGNHRLLTMIINHFLEFKSATSEEEKIEVNNKYSMELEVNMPISSKLADLLRRETDRCSMYNHEQGSYPDIACEYRMKTFNYSRNAFYAVEYDEQTKIFNYNFNGEKFTGTEQELINFLQNKEQKTEPIMRWEVDGVYYMSCNNKIYKSNNPEKIEALYPKLVKGYHDEKIEYGEFAEIKDIDTETYSIEFPSIFISDKEEAKYFADTIRYFVTNEKETFFCKLKNAETVKNAINKNIEEAFGVFGWFDLCDLVYEGLTKEEYAAVRKIMFALDEQLNWTRNNEV